MHTADLNNIRYLVEVADSGSFSAAARALGVPPSLVSRRIARLETEVGARLLQRTTRSIAWTEAGTAFLEHSRAAIQALVRAQEVLGNLQESPRGRVRISAPSGLAEAMWTVVSRFLATHPAINVEMDFIDRFVDLIEGRVDLAVRAAQDRQSEKLVGRRLMDAPRCLFASPEYLRVHGHPRSLRDLSDHSCVIHGPRSDRVTWVIHVGKRKHSVIVGGRVAVNEARTASDCAADGYGIAFLPLAVCARHVASARLVRIFPRASGGETALWLVYPNRHLPAASRQLAEFLIAQLPAEALRLQQVSGGH